jgi:hypothetical protein
MGLTQKETRMLEALMRKKDQPDAPPASRSLNISIDLGDEKQVERARGLGLLDWITGDDDGDGDGDDDKNGKNGDGDGDDDDDDVPRRRGYFNQ